MTLTATRSIRSCNFRSATASEVGYRLPVPDRREKPVAAWFGCRVERPYLQVPAAHPIRVGLGLAGKRLGSKGQARPFGYAAAYDRMLGRWGLGSADKLPIGAGSGSYASPAPLPWGMQRGRGVSGPLAKMCETQWRSHVVTHTSCDMR